MQIIDPSYWFVKVILSFTGIYSFSCSLLDFAWNPAFFAPPLLPKKKRISLKIYCFSMTSPYYVLNACCVSCFCLKCLRFLWEILRFLRAPLLPKKKRISCDSQWFFPPGMPFLSHGSPKYIQRDAWQGLPAWKKSHALQRLGAAVRGFFAEPLSKNKPRATTEQANL